MSVFGTGKFKIIGSDTNEYEPDESTAGINSNYIKDDKKTYKSITGKNHVFNRGQYLNIIINDVALTKANYDIIKTWNSSTTITLTFKIHSDKTQTVPVKITSFEPYYFKSNFFHDAVMIKLVSIDPVVLTSI